MFKGTETCMDSLKVSSAVYNILTLGHAHAVTHIQYLSVCSSLPVCGNSNYSHKHTITSHIHKYLLYELRMTLHINYTV